MSSSARQSAGALFLGLLLALPYQASASSPSVAALVDKYAAKYGVPLYVARNLVHVESGGRQDAVSPTGARGVMQLTPATARALGVDINDPEQNIEGGMRYLRSQYDRFGRWDLALAAYHLGPQAVIKHGGVPPKSQAYVRSILGSRTIAARTQSIPRRTDSKRRNEAAPQLTNGFSWPVQGPITYGFGWHGQRYHAGIDISAPHSTRIRAARAGTVALANWYYDYGRTIIINHGDGVSTLYGHTSRLLVTAGEAVREGHVIALVGCTGRCTGPHVHFEVRVNGRAVDPLGPLATAAAKPLAQSPPSSKSPASEKAKKTSHQTANRRTGVTVNGNRTTTVTDTLRNSQVVRRVELTVFVQGQLRIRVLREFRLIDGVLTLVKERTRVRKVDNDDEDEEEDEDDQDEEDEEDD